MDSEKSTVDEYGFGKLAGWFVDKYLKHDGETLEEANSCESGTKSNSRKKSKQRYK